MMEVNHAEKIEYVIFDSLNNPEMTQISDIHIQLGFESKQWTIQFQTLTHLRQANKHYPAIFLNELLPKFYRQIIAQVQNLRSNNSKEALTLLSEIFTLQSLNKVNANIIRPIVAVLFSKSVCEKGFLRNEALKAINKIPNCWNPSVMEELTLLTHSNNGQISELAIKIMGQMLDKNEVTQVDEKFLKELCYNINGKRSVIQKQAKSILENLKKRLGSEKLESLIDDSSQLDPQESNTLKRQLKKNDSLGSKSSSNFRQFMKKKKGELHTTA